MLGLLRGGLRAHEYILARGPPKYHGLGPHCGGRPAHNWLFADQVPLSRGPHRLDGNANLAFWGSGQARLVEVECSSTLGADQRGYGATN